MECDLGGNLLTCGEFTHLPGVLGEAVSTAHGWSPAVLWEAARV